MKFTRAIRQRATHVSIQGGAILKPGATKAHPAYQLSSSDTADRKTRFIINRRTRLP